MKKPIVLVVVALAVAAFLPRPAAAGIWENGIWSNGIWENGIWENGIWKNGNWQNGIWENGVWGKGIWDNGEMSGIGPQCTDGVDFSAVPLARVTVRLPQRMR